MHQALSHPGAISITSTESFAARAQRSEARRVMLWTLVLLAMLALTLLRRALGGRVMSADAVFYPTVGVLLLATAAQVGLWSALRRANRIGRLLPTWVLPASATVDLLVPTAMLAISAWNSPRGAVPALSAPPLLMMPLLVLTSVLRLRPMFTLYTGLACAVIHWSLAARAIAVAGESAAQFPVYLSYGCVLALTAVAGMLVAQDVKSHVSEALREAAAHEASERLNAAVQHDLTIARDIQRGLLPVGSPAYPGFDIVGMNRPADKTGGDYFDWQLLSDGRLVVVLADVSGHGIGPAIVMAVCRAYTRSSDWAVGDPSHLLRRINVLLHGDLPGDRFITLVVTVLDRAGQAQLLSAGHGPTLLYRVGTGEVSEFHGDGIPLGIMDSEEYGPATSLPMEAGDVLVMLTDGFFEWSRPGDNEQFGIRRLCETLQRSAHGDAAMILRSLDDAVRAFAGGSPQPDDMTAVVIKRAAVPAAASNGDGMSGVAGHGLALSDDGNVAVTAFD